MVEVGKRLDNWLSKASATSTRYLWKSCFQAFAKWVVETRNPLTDKPLIECDVNEVDEVIRMDFESMPSHLFQDKYKDILTKYAAYLSKEKSNTTRTYVSAIQSFLTNEAMGVKMPRNKLPKPEMAKGEHQFTLDEFRQMWLVADTEGKARLSTAVSLGWGVGDFVKLKTERVRKYLEDVDGDGYVSFDYGRQKTKARVRGILNPGAVADLKNYLERVPVDQEFLWSVKTKTGLNYWFKRLYEEARLKDNGTIRFHLIRKYTFSVAVHNIGPYAAKLLVGKNIKLEDATYLQGLEDRLLERYKKLAYPFLKLSGVETIREDSDRVKQLENVIRAMNTTFIYTQNWSLNELRKRGADTTEMENVIKKYVEHTRFLSEKEG